jgi:hypothetical protein
MKRDSLMFAVPLLMFVVLSLSVQAQVSFFQPPTYAGAGNVFVADFNGDGKPDILTSDGTMNLGNGDGTFKPGTSVSVSSSQVLAVADFNGDGKPDVLEQGTGTLLVMLGNGDGTFQPPISTASGASFFAVATTDLNGDGKADVVGVFGSSLFVYISKGDGTFASGVSYNLGAASAGVPLLSLGDFNGDGKTDVLVSTTGTTVVAGQEIVLVGNGDGTFQTTLRTSTGVYLWGSSAVTGDFNGDGKLDLVVTGVSGFCNGACIGPGAVYILLGNGDGTFEAPVLSISLKAPSDGFLNTPLGAADLNGDGKLDLVLQYSSSFAQIYLGNGDGTFSNTSNYVLNMPLIEAYAPSTGIAIADFNLDGKRDIASGDSVQLGNGDGTFQGIQIALVPGYMSISGIAVGDFDKNGAPDVAATSSPYINGTVVNYLFVLSNDGTGKLSLTNTYTLQDSATSIVTADFNGDGNLDLVVIGRDSINSDWSYSVLLGNGNGSFQSPVFHPQNVNGGGTAVVADFNHDGKLDFAMADGQSVAVFLGNGDGTFGAPVLYFDGGGSFLVTADFNGDGKLDLATGGPPTALLFGNGDGTFQAAVFPANLNAFAPVFTADLNNDGKPDLLSYNQVAMGNGDGTLTLLPALANNIDAAADLNGDGKLDLLVGIVELIGHSAGGGVQLGNGDGTFGAVIRIGSPGNYLLSGLVVDMNGDGRPDLIVSPTNGVAVVLNTTPPGFGVSAGALSPTPVIAGNAATSTVTVTPAFGFTGAVTLSCTGQPSGASCSFNPPSIANSSGTSALTITTSASVAEGTYTLQIQGSAGSIVNSAPGLLVVQGAADFSMGAASGSPTSQTITAGQTASFSLAFAPAGSFTGTVSLSCALTPAVTPAPTCSLSSKSVQINGSAPQTVTVTVGTTAPATMGAVSHVGVPIGPIPMTCMLMLLGMGCLLLRNRKWLPILAAPVIVLVMASWVGCGGSGSSSHTTSGTPVGTYSATITATSGNLNHNMTFTVVVQ